LCSAGLKVGSVIYRPYASGDFDPLYAIEELCFQPPFRFSRRYMRRLVDRRNSATWIAEEDGRMAGFAIVDWSQEIDGISSYIQTIEVVPDRRGQGVGKELLWLIEDSARAEGAHRLWLHVDEFNKAGIRLYESVAFTVQGKEVDYYAPGHAALIYQKLLEPDSVL